jgi:hypothetical protein
MRSIKHNCQTASIHPNLLLRPFKIPNVMNGADMGEAVWSVDKTAVISEVIATPFVFIDESVKFIKSKF